MDKRSRLPVDAEEEAEEDREAGKATEGASLMTEAKTEGEFHGRNGFWQQRRARGHQPFANSVSESAKDAQRGVNPFRNTTGAGMSLRINEMQKEPLSRLMEFLYVIINK